MEKHSEGSRLLKYMLSILIPVLLLTVVYFMMTGRNMVRLSTESMQQQSVYNADKINNYMLEVVNDMEEVRELIESNCSTNEEVETFVRSTESYGVFGGVYTGDNTGFYVGSTPWDIPDDYDPTTRPWYIDGKDSREFVFGEPYLDASVDTMCISVSARMDAGDDSIVRVIAADIYLNYMDSLAEDLVAGSDLEGALIITGDTGMIVADSTGEYAGEQLAETSDFYTTLDKAIVDKDAGLYTITASSGIYYVSVEDIPATDWYLVVYEKRSTILHDLYVTEGVMALAAVAVGLFLIWVMRRYGREVSEVEQQANKAKTEFISRISHDIRTPIGQVLNLTEFAKADKDDPEKLTEDLDRIDSSGRFLLSLINDVLDVSQIESGLMEMHPTVTTYKDYMADIRNIMIPMCENKGLKCEIISENEDEIPDMYCDSVRLKQITLNLISNAVKYTPYGGTITYISESGTNKDGGLSFGFTLKDTGVGMTKEFMENMYDKFTRDTGNELRDKTQMGSGLGLYLVKNMVDLMNGTIEYQSELGEGTSVTVHVDFDKAPETAAYESGNRASAGNDNENADAKYKGNVLLVEDNELNMMIATRMLEELGLTVDYAADGEEAVNKFRDSAGDAYRLIFMDIQMPKMNGYDATRAIRGMERTDAQTIPIIAMTADAFKDAEDESKMSGMTGFITKPLIIDQICSILDKYNMNA